MYRLRYLALAIVLVALARDSAPARAAANLVVVAKIEGPIMPPTRDYLTQTLARASEQKATCLVVEVDTPGGRGDSMREIAQLFLGSATPVVVYVTPAGAQCASAGAIIAISANLVAMAPATNIGAAHPVMSTGGDIPGDMKDKVINDMSAFVRGLAEKRGKSQKIAEDFIRKSVSFSATEAKQNGIADLLAADRADLLRQLNGRRVTTSAGVRTLRTVPARTEQEEPSWLQALLMFLLNPNVALIMWAVAGYGIIAEINHPGAIFPGVTGGIALILALYAMSVLSVNTAGIALLILSFLLFGFDLYAPTHGVLTLGGIVAFIVGSLMLFNEASSGVRVSLAVVVTLALVSAVFFGTIVAAAMRARRRPPGSGPETLLGKKAEARTPVNPEGTVFFDGAFWNAQNVGDKPIDAGDPVSIVARDGLTLHVKSAVETQAEPIYAKPTGDQPAG